MRDPTDIEHLREWDVEQAPTPGHSILRGQWEIGFLYFCVALFGVWVGITGDGFEGVMGVCIPVMGIGLVVVGIGQKASEDLLRDNAKRFFQLTVFFAIVVCVCHFLRLKVDPPSSLV